MQLYQEKKEIPSVGLTLIYQVVNNLDKQCVSEYFTWFKKQYQLKKRSIISIFLQAQGEKCSEGTLVPYQHIALRKISFKGV